MINPDNGYLKAQRSYDKQEPEDDSIQQEEDSRREAYEDWQERKAEEDREERLIEEFERLRKLDPQNPRYSELGECRENE